MKKLIKYYRKFSFGKERYYFVDEEQKREIRNIQLHRLTPEKMTMLMKLGYSFKEITPPLSPPPNAIQESN